MNKDREVELVDSEEAEVDPMVKMVDLTILYKIKASLNGRKKIKARPNGKVVIPTKVVQLLIEEEVILTIEEDFMVNIIDVVKKVIDPLNARDFVKLLA